MGITIRSIFSIGSTLGAALLFSNYLAAATASIPYVAESPAIDGVIEAGWGDGVELVPGIAIQNGGVPATAHVLWNETGLYIAVEVSDTTRFRDSGGESWNDDAVELYLDGDLSGGTSFDGVDDYQIRILPNGTGEVLTNGPPGGITIAAVTSETATGYIVEVRLALAAIPGDSGTSATLGFDWQVGDDTDGGPRDRKSGWSDSTDMGWKYPSVFGSLTLEAAPEGEHEDISMPASAQVPYTAVAPEIDGDFEDLWEDAARVHPAQVVFGEDMIANARVLWNTDGFYLAMEVMDGTPQRDSGSSSWLDDCVEVFLDGDLSMATSYDGANDFMIRILPVGAGEVIVSGPSQALTSEVKVVDAGASYRLEARFAFPGLPTDAQLGGTIGFDLATADDVDGGVCEKKVAWSDTTNQGWSDTSLFGRLTLLPERTPGAVIAAMNLGGSEMTASDGTEYRLVGKIAPRTYLRRKTLPSVSGTADVDLFNTYLYEDSRLMYWVPLANGLYEVDLGWAAPVGENNIFDVTLQSRLVEDDFDPQVEAGGAGIAFWRSYPVQVTNRRLDISLFRGPGGYPFLSVFRVRVPESQPANRAPEAATVSIPAVRSTGLRLGAEVFAERVFDADGDPPMAWLLTAEPRHGAFWVGPRCLGAGSVLRWGELASLRFEPEPGFTGRDFFQWQVADEEDWSEPAAGLVYVRQSLGSVDLGVEPRWNTFQWPLFAYYPEAPSYKHGASQGPDGVYRDGNACGPTARTYLMHYWRHPRIEAGTVNYTDLNGNRIEVVQTEPYAYGQMRGSLGWDSPESDYAATARLFADNWLASIDISNSGFNVHATVAAYFDFSSDFRLVEKAELPGEAAWEAALRAELDRGRLVIVSGFSDTGGHWWLVDGYRADGLFHVKLNYGNADGYYPAANMAGYYKELTMVAGAYPESLGQVRLLSPQGGEQWGTGQRRLIRWSAPQAAAVDLEYSLNGGFDWQTIATGVDAQKGYYLWETDAAPSAELCVRVSDSDNLNAYDESDPSATTSASSWIQNYYNWADGVSGLPAGDRAPELDADRDGYPHLMNYLAWLDDSASADPTGLVRGQIDSATGELVFRLPLPPGADASCLEVLASKNLSLNDFAPFADEGECTVNVVGNGIEARIASSASDRYFRFRWVY